MISIVKKQFGSCDDNKTSPSCPAVSAASSSDDDDVSANASMILSDDNPPEQK